MIASNYYDRSNYRVDYYKNNLYNNDRFRDSITLSKQATDLFSNLTISPVASTTKQSEFKKQDYPIETNWNFTDNRKSNNLNYAPGRNYSNDDLQGIKFDGASMFNSNFKNANLKNADLS